MPSGSEELPILLSCLLASPSHTFTAIHRLELTRPVGLAFRTHSGPRAPPGLDHGTLGSQGSCEVLRGVDLILQVD